MNEHLQDLMRDATRLTRDGRLTDATRLIQQALSGATGAPSAGADRRDSDTRSAGPAPRVDIVLDGCVTEVAEPADSAARPAAPPSAGDNADTGADAILRGRHAHGGTSRDYRLFVPAGASGRGRPLVVMLHGCTQDPDDFAAGTAMDTHARDQGVLVLYPAQSARANPQRCWNWFKHTHQQGHRGEPGVIAAMTQAVVQAHGVDPDRVYVAGLSAGGAMAAITAACHPDVFSAVGVHSGLAPDAAATLPDALAAMRGESARGASAGGARRAIDIPTIVFHGDRDSTVHPRNAEAVIAAVAGGPADAGAARSERGASARGGRFTRVVHPARGARPEAEHWILHGTGHAWSGGSPAGSYVDPNGPDASGEMLRFFLAHPRAERAH